MNADEPKPEVKPAQPETMAEAANPKVDSKAGEKRDCFCVGATDR